VTRPSSVALRSGDRLLVTGPNGAGKSTLLAVLAGELTPDHGTTAIAATARLGLVAQESRSRDRRTARAVYDARLRQLRADGMGGDLVPIGALGLLSNADLARPATELSMGQQRRLDLALALAARPHALLLDEPTNHLSIALVDELTDAFGHTPRRSSSSATTARCATTSPTGQPSHSPNADDRGLHHDRRCRNSDCGRCF
jgi:macrolide transport system ATP-binding/permease protein